MEGGSLDYSGSGFGNVACSRKHSSGLCLSIKCGEFLYNPRNYRLFEKGVTSPVICLFFCPGY